MLTLSAHYHPFPPPLPHNSINRRSIADRVFRTPSAAEGGGGGDDDDNTADSNTQLDEVHLALIKGVAGAPNSKVGTVGG